MEVEWNHLVSKKEIYSPNMSNHFILENVGITWFQVEPVV